MKTFRNMGGLDRLTRLLLGVVLVAVVFLAPLPAGLAVTAFVAAGVLLGTSTAGVCLLYVPLGIDTRRRIPAR